MTIGPRLGEAGRVGRGDRIAGGDGTGLPRVEVGMWAGGLLAYCNERWNHVLPLRVILSPENVRYYVDIADR